MPANSSINLISLDVNTVKSELKTFLQGQEQFRDYNFDGSDFAVLLDILAMNTYKNAFFYNMVLSESFLDSAQLRNSVISHAKELNYLPRSARSAEARLSVSYQATGESQPYLIPKGSSFTAMVKNETFVFSIPESITVSSSNNTFSFTTTAYEGVYLKDTYLFGAGVENQKFRITNKNIDTRSLTVTVYEDNSLIGTTFLQAETLLGANELSKIFFLQMSETGHYEVLFGDNVLGRSPKNNSLIILDYRVSSSSRPNGAKIFSLNFDPTSDNSESTNNAVVSTIIPAFNGKDAESIESIRYYAPRHFQTQERTVTTTDYEIALKNKFPEINAVAVYGGEELNPPRFGKVAVSIDISDIDGLPESKKNEYRAFLKARSMLSMDPIFIEPEFLFIHVSSIIRYNLNLTTLSDQSIKTLVMNTVVNYNNDNLDDFNTTFRYSKFVSDIDNSDISIISNSTDIQVYKKVNPKIGSVQNIAIDYGMKIMKNSTVSFVSDSFRLDGTTVRLQDDTNGNIQIVKTEGTTDVKIRNIGTINYEMGTINLTNFRIDSYTGSALKMFIRPADRDIKSPKNTIISIEQSELVITLEQLRI